MYKSHVAAGKIIEIQADRVLTQQGDTFCTYHFRYYMLPEAEKWTEAEAEPEEGSAIQKRGWFREKQRKQAGSPAKPWFTLQKKSANRI